MSLAINRALFIFVLFLILSLTGCVGNNPYAPEGQKIIGYRGLSEDPRTLDPAQVSDTNSAEILCQIYDSLYQNAYLDRPYKVEPALADGYPEKRIFDETVLEKGVTKKVTRMEYIFRLKDDIYFQDDPCFPGGKGRAVTSQDIVYSIKRLADPSVQSTGSLARGGENQRVSISSRRRHKAPARWTIPGDRRAPDAR